MENLRELLEKTERIKPIGEFDGKQLVSIEDQRDMAELEFRTGKETLDTVQYTPEHTVARTPGKVVSVSPDRYFLNRFKKVKDALYVVRDYRAITEQSTGQVYLKAVPVYVIKRDETKKLVLDKVTTVSDVEFVADFTDELDREAMAMILPLIDTGVGVTKTNLPI